MFRNNEEYLNTVQDLGQSLEPINIPCTLNIAYIDNQLQLPISPMTLFCHYVKKRSIDFYAATGSAAAFPFPFPGLDRPQATFAFFPSTSIPPCAANPSDVRSANARVLKFTNAQSVVSFLLSSSQMAEGKMAEESRETRLTLSF